MPCRCEEGCGDESIIATPSQLDLYFQEWKSIACLAPAETLRAQIAADLFRVERERSKTLLATARRDLAIVMGDGVPRFGVAVGRLATVGQPPSFQAVIQAIEANPQLTQAV
jgi:cobalt-zinc-cadmium efflux system outer membrane protein